MEAGQSPFTLSRSSNNRQVAKPSIGSRKYRRVWAWARRRPEPAHQTNGRLQRSSQRLTELPLLIVRDVAAAPAARERRELELAAQLASGAELRPARHLAGPVHGRRYLGGAQLQVAGALRVQRCAEAQICRPAQVCMFMVSAMTRTASAC